MAHLFDGLLIQTLQNHTLSHIKQYGEVLMTWQFLKKVESNFIKNIFFNIQKKYLKGKEPK